MRSIGCHRGCYGERGPVCFCLEKDSRSQTQSLKDGHVNDAIEGRGERDVHLLLTAQGRPTGEEIQGPVRV